MEGASAAAVNLVSGLLHPEPGFRIGTTMAIGEILHHPWFSDVDVNALREGTLPSPFRLGAHRLLVNKDQMQKREMKLRVNEDL